jgi:NADH-quinone oxidoreductase subunit G
MPQVFINGKPVEADTGTTVLEAATSQGIDIPCFCWHKSLSVAGNCRLCVVETEEGGWLDIACNMPVSEGMRVLTDTKKVREHRAAMLQLLTLNHPLDCGVCDKSGECKLQDYHFEYNGARSVSVDPKVHASKFVELNDRVLLDNERCILCSRCVRFTAEISKSHGLGIVQRGDHAVVRAAENGAFEKDAYSENVVDICPVGALLSRSFMYRSRVWYLSPTPSVCPGCERGCNVDIWHRDGRWQLRSLDPRQNVAIARVTPRENATENGPWICDKGRDLAQIFERPRASQPMIAGTPVALEAAIDAARRLTANARQPLALVSNWGSNEELQAFKDALAERFAVRIKLDRSARPGEVVADDLLIRPDKNPNSAGARKLFPDAAPWTANSNAVALDRQYDLVLAWGEGFDLACVPTGVPVIVLNAYAEKQNEQAAVFLPISIQTERRGHYTSFAGLVNGFEPCFEKAPTVAHAEALFAALAARTEAPA